MLTLHTVFLIQDVVLNWPDFLKFCGYWMVHIITLLLILKYFNFRSIFISDFFNTSLHYSNGNTLYLHYYIFEFVVEFNRYVASYTRGLKCTAFGLTFVVHYKNF